MPFVPITLGRYVDMFLKDNPGSDRSAVTERLKVALASFKAGELCSCGQPIWVLGSAEVGNSCFTCITGESEPTEDYELDEVCGTGRS